MAPFLAFAADVLVWIIIGACSFSCLYLAARIFQARRTGWRRPEED